MIRKGRRIVVSKEIMITISLIDAGVLTRKGKTNGVTSWLTIVEVLLHNIVSEIVLRNCVHVIGSGANVEGVFDKDAVGPSFISCRLVVCNTFLVSLLY